MVKVSVNKCTSYDPEIVKQAVLDAVNAVTDLKSLIRPGSKVLLKPNILMGYAPERAVTTHPQVLFAIGCLVKDLGGKLLVGDSGGFGTTAKNAQKSGLSDVVNALDATLLPFDDPVNVDVPSGQYVKHFMVERAVTEADVIINLPKCKTHGLTYFTGATKNLYGCLPGLEKGKGHMKMPTRELFSEMIVDLNLAVRPQLNIMDAIVGMEGHGPSNGDPRHIGLILASTDTFALDCAAAQIIGLQPEEVPYLKIAIERGLLSLLDFEWVGESLESVRISDFKLINKTAPRSWRNVLLSAFGSTAKNLLLEKPVVLHEKCRKCNICVEVCPVKTISATKDGPVYNYKNCIHCYCCQEMCPHGAIVLKRKLF